MVILFALVPYSEDVHPIRQAIAGKISHHLRREPGLRGGMGDPGRKYLRASAAETLGKLSSSSRIRAGGSRGLARARGPRHSQRTA